MAKKSKGKGIFAEFKAFITRGNIVDMAVGVIIGGAFTAIVTALTANVFQPLINFLLSLSGSGDALENARTILGTAVKTIDETGVEVIDWSNTIYIDWGVFISAVINFLLVAMILFAILKIATSIAKSKAKIEAEMQEAYYVKHPEERPVPPEPGAPVPTELDYLKEIAELLKKDHKE